MRLLKSFVAVVAALSLSAQPAWAWGDNGHKIIALIALHYLRDNDPATLHRVEALLQSDADTLTPPDIASRATWADRYRDGDRNTTQIHYRQTRNWHFIDIDVADPAAHPNLDRPCFNHPPLAANTLASGGAADDCVVDKIDQFASELDHSTDPTERLLAFKFLLHFVGDVHQPLHGAERNHDRGGNEIGVVWDRHLSPEPLHAYWDNDVVRAWGADPNTVADTLYAALTRADIQSARTGDARAWAIESWRMARQDVYRLPARPAGTYTPSGRSDPIPFYRLSADYRARAKIAASERLQRAGLRLAWVMQQHLHS